MTTQTRETLDALAEILRYGAEKRLELNPHGDTAHVMHAIANEIVIANSLGKEK